jgi:RimJ/RimL family protein N-acetyltransferase
MQTETKTVAQTQPTLETARLILRPFELRDAKEVQRLAGDLRIAQMTLAVPHPYPDGEAESWIASHPNDFHQGVGIVFAIVLKSDQALIGAISITGISKTHRRGEAGYWIACDFWNQGYCTEALKTLIDYGFRELNLNKVTSRHMTKNPQSGRVMLKAGMKQEGLLKDDCFRYGRFEDSAVYGITREDFQLSKQGSSIHLG